MQIVSILDNSIEMTKPVSGEKKKKIIQNVNC